ncbi:hypothetical protein GLOIN_2v1885182 [Rhizophagus irregularis DAOM 181602=DAOM 197198]|nr:hypothetical protein GLOIN_2v1885182 [Rhizophagus irregularis DAOM 181602=DAOM 197198]
MEAERAMDMEKEIVQDTYGPNSKSSSGNDKGKATEKSKVVVKDLSRDPPLLPQNIVNNVNGTNKVLTLNKEIISTPHKDQQQSVVLPNQDKINLQADQGSQPMDVDPSNSNKDPSIITIEKVKEHIALVPYGELIGGKNLKTTKIKKALQTYNIQYNKQLPVTPLGKQGAKVSFLDKEKFDQFLKIELVIQEQKEGDSGEVFNVKLQPTPLKPEKVATTNDKDSDTSQNSNNRTIQVIDIPAFRQVREIRESFEDLGEIEKIYTRGAGLYQVAFITYKDATSIDYLKEQWSYHINKDIVRVLPLLLSKEEREKRKQFSLRLSGLHYQTSGYDLKEEQIINTIRKVEDKLLNMESLISDTGKQIGEVVTTQQALKCDKAHPVPVKANTTKSPGN